MNFGIVKYMIGKVIAIEGFFMVLPAITALVYGEWKGLFVYLLCGAMFYLFGRVLQSRHYVSNVFYAKEGYVIAALAWVVISLLGAVPFVVTGDIPSYVDALFEIASGFTTTGASILNNPEELLHCNLLWRSFSHWLGGMGVLVFLLALLPTGGESLYIMRAESTGPSVGKIVPRIQQTSKILYMIYAGLTLVLLVLLLIGRMPLFDAICTAVGTAGTGGFGIKADSMAGYGTYAQVVVTIFMLLFGVSFSFYYLLISGKIKAAFQMEEVRWYIGIYLIVTIIISLNVWNGVGSFWHQLQQSAFQTSSVMTTTGFATQDFDTWPMLSKFLMGFLMLVGACSGSTAGGLKLSRVIIYLKGIKKELSSQIHPNRVKVLCMDGKRIADETLHVVYVYLALFVVIFLMSVCVVSLEGHDWETTFSAVLATLNNIGPGFGMVGPTANYGFFTPLSKLVLTFDMLAGRLELIPMVILLAPSTWRKNG
jgi:trk system potassium uptake protein TrkH